MKDKMAHIMKHEAVTELEKKMHAALDDALVSLYDMCTRVRAHICVYTGMCVCGELKRQCLEALLISYRALHGTSHQALIFIFSNQVGLASLHQIRILNRLSVSENQGGCARTPRGILYILGHTNLNFHRVPFSNFELCR